MVNGTGLTSGSIAWSGACGGGDCVDNELVKVRGFSEGERVGFDKVLGSWIQVVDMETWSPSP